MLYLPLIPAAGGVIAFLLTSVAVWRAPDALSRSNVMPIIPGVAVPLLIMAKLANDWVTVGFNGADFVRACLAITGLLVVVSVASFAMGRSIYGVSVEDARLGPTGVSSNDPAPQPAQPKEKPLTPRQRAEARKKRKMK